MADFDKYSDVIDGRDIAARIEELADERNELTSAIQEVQDNIAENNNGEYRPDDQKADLQNALESSQQELADWDEENNDELSTLRGLADELDNCNSEWRDGEAIIRYSYFKEYAMQLADDIGAIDNNARWPATCIDWDQAAKELGYDYSTVTFGDVDYYIRST